MTDPEMWRRAAPAFSLVGSMTGSVIVGALIGTGLDRHFGTKPWLLLVMVVGGFLVGMRHLFFFLRQTRRHDPPVPPPP